MGNNDLLPKSLIQKRLNLKKSLIRTMAGLGTAAILFTGTGCDQTIGTTETVDPIINRETEYLYQDTEPTVTTPIETEGAETSQGEREPVVIESYNDIVSSGKLEEYQQIFEAEQASPYETMAYGTRFNPTCYDYFRNLYPEATDDEISKYTRIYFEFVSDNDLYVALSSSVRMQKMEGIPNGIEQYSFLKFENIGEYEEKLNDSNNDVFKHSILLNEVMNNYNYDIMAETSALNNSFSYIKLGFNQSDLLPNIKKSTTNINGYNELTGKKYFYFVAPSFNDLSKLALFKCETKDTFDIEKDPDFYLNKVTFNGKEAVEMEELCYVDYFNKFSFDLTVEFDNEINR